MKSSSQETSRATKNLNKLGRKEGGGYYMPLHPPLPEKMTTTIFSGKMLILIYKYILQVGDLKDNPILLTEIEM